MELSRTDVASKLLSATSVEALRKEARRNRRWASIYPGFRPDSLTRPLFLRGARAFAASSGDLHRLCHVFLDRAGVADGKDLKARFEEAAKLTSLDQEIRDLCTMLATTDVLALPRAAAVGEDTTASTARATQGSAGEAEKSNEQGAPDPSAPKG